MPSKSAYAYGWRRDGSLPFLPLGRNEVRFPYSTERRYQDLIRSTDGTGDTLAVTFTELPLVNVESSQDLQHTLKSGRSSITPLLLANMLTRHATRRDRRIAILRGIWTVPLNILQRNPDRLPYPGSPTAYSPGSGWWVRLAVYSSMVSRLDNLPPAVPPAPRSREYSTKPSSSAYIS